jgi:hypothetical protein
MSYSSTVFVVSLAVINHIIFANRTQMKHFQAAGSKVRKCMFFLPPVIFTVVSCSDSYLYLPSVCLIFGNVFTFRVKFGVPLDEVCKNDIPGPLLVSNPDLSGVLFSLFRRTIKR